MISHRDPPVEDPHNIAIELYNPNVGLIRFFVYFIAHAAFVDVAQDLIEHMTARKLGESSRVVVVNSWGELLG